MLTRQCIYRVSISLPEPQAPRPSRDNRDTLPLIPMLNRSGSIEIPLPRSWDVTSPSEWSDYLRGSGDDYESAASFSSAPFRDEGDRDGGDEGMRHGIHLSCGSSNGCQHPAHGPSTEREARTRWASLTYLYVWGRSPLLHTLINRESGRSHFSHTSTHGSAMTLASLEWK